MGINNKLKLSAICREANEHGSRFYKAETILVTSVHKAGVISRQQVFWLLPCTAEQVFYKAETITASSVPKEATVYKAETILAAPVT